MTFAAILSMNKREEQLRGFHCSEWGAGQWRRGSETPGHSEGQAYRDRVAERNGSDRRINTVALN